MDIVYRVLLFMVKRTNIVWKRNADSFVFGESGSIQLQYYCIAVCFPAIIVGYFVKLKYNQEIKK